MSPDDAEFWDELWKIPSSAEEVFELVTPDAARKLRDERFENLATLFTQATAQLCQIVETPYNIYFDQALNCVRVLTRILPFLLEKGESSRVESSRHAVLRRNSYGKWVPNTCLHWFVLAAFRTNVPRHTGDPIWCSTAMYPFSLLDYWHCIDANFCRCWVVIGDRFFQILTDASSSNAFHPFFPLFIFVR